MFRRDLVLWAIGSGNGIQVLPAKGLYLMNIRNIMISPIYRQATLIGYKYYFHKIFIDSVQIKKLEECYIMRSIPKHLLCNIQRDAGYLINSPPATVPNQLLNLPHQLVVVTLEGWLQFIGQ